MVSSIIKYINITLNILYWDDDDEEDDNDDLLK